MRTVTERIHVRRSPDEVFAVLEDIADYPRFFVGMERWEPIGEVEQQVGDRFWILMRTGANSVGGIIGITELDRPSRIAWTSENGTDHDVRIDVAPAAGGCDVSIALTYRLAGGLASRFIEWTASGIVRRNLVATLEALRHLCEWGPADGLGSRA